MMSDGRRIPGESTTSNPPTFPYFFLLNLLFVEGVRDLGGGLRDPLVSSAGIAILHRGQIQDTAI